MICGGSNIHPKSEFSVPNDNSMQLNFFLRRKSVDLCPNKLLRGTSRIEFSINYTESLKALVFKWMYKSLMWKCFQEFAVDMRVMQFWKDNRIRLPANDTLRDSKLIDQLWLPTIDFVNTKTCMKILMLQQHINTIQICVLPL